MRRSRIKTKYKKRELLLKQKNKCNLCKKELKENEYSIDHIIPLGFNGKDEYENMQLLCINCHLKKTREENYCKQSKECKR